MSDKTQQGGGVSRRSYQRRVAEAFGYPPEASSPQAVQARTEHLCPFLGVRCVKPSQHRDYDPKVPFGACSVWHRGRGVQEPQPYIICPIRFVQEQRVFLDASRLLSGTGEVVVIPEISLPIGRIDYILSLIDPLTQKVADFIVLEVMTCSTTSTGDVLRSLHDILEGRVTERRLKYGINFRQVVSRMTVQVLAKAHACERWHKRLVWAVQDVLYQYMRATTKLDLESMPLAELENVPEEMSILFLSYGMERDLSSENERFEIKLKEAYGGTKESFARVLEPLEVPRTEKLLELIQQRMGEESTFTLHTPLSEGLAKAAPGIVRSDV
ncbi:MAG: NotI family restriction endonuclease [candidate division WOR-3 bacterium]